MRGDFDVTPKIERAAAYLADIPWSERPVPIIPFLKRRFGVSEEEATTAIRLASLRQARAT